MGPVRPPSRGTPAASSPACQQPPPDLAPVANFAFVARQPGALRVGVGEERHQPVDLRCHESLVRPPRWRARRQLFVQRRAVRALVGVGGRLPGIGLDAQPLEEPSTEVGRALGVLAHRDKHEPGGGEVPEVRLDAPGGQRLPEALRHQRRPPVQQGHVRREDPREGAARRAAFGPPEALQVEVVLRVDAHQGVSEHDHQVRIPVADLPVEAADQGRRIPLRGHLRHQSQVRGRGDSRDVGDREVHHDRALLRAGRQTGEPVLIHLVDWRARGAPEEIPLLGPVVRSGDEACLADVQPQ
mmetsp:Transcript_87817/g.256688  ORF Transcript_87817/g.256688 Transcript_87817/m.256688 type:complete len:299 (+) Transcript_87817:91-987(+)